MLIRYRTSMASEDCGGSVEARKFFKVMRIVHSTASFKETLLQQFEDANYILDCEWKCVTRAVCCVSLLYSRLLLTRLCVG